MRNEKHPGRNDKKAKIAYYEERGKEQGAYSGKNRQFLSFLVLQNAGFSRISSPIIFDGGRGAGTKGALCILAVAQKITEKESCMKNEIASYLEEYNVNVDVLKDDNEYVNMFFGTLVSQSIDYWLENSSKFIENNETEETFSQLNDDKKRMYKNNMEILSKLNLDVKEIIKQLIKESMEGALFSLFVKMDQPPYGKFKIILESEDGGKIGIVNNNVDLHEELFKWRYLFNENE